MTRGRRIVILVAALLLMVCWFRFGYLSRCMYYEGVWSLCDDPPSPAE